MPPDVAYCGDVEEGAEVRRARKETPATEGINKMVPQVPSMVESITALVQHARSGLGGSGGVGKKDYR